METKILNNLAEFVRQHRLKKNITQEQLANEAGINRWTVSKFEKGESVSLHIFIQILRVLDLLHMFDAFEITEETSPLKQRVVKLPVRKRARNAQAVNEVDNEVSDWQFF